MLVLCVSERVIIPHVFIIIFGEWSGGGEGGQENWRRHIISQISLKNLINSCISVHAGILKNKSFCFFGFIGLLKKITAQ